MSETSFDVSIRSIETRKRINVTTYRVEWTVASKRFREPFKLMGLAKSFHSALTAAAKKGEAFRIDDGLPVSMARKIGTKTWFQLVTMYINFKWPKASAGHRRNMTEAMTTATFALLKSTRGRPSDAEIAGAAKFVANPNNKDREPPGEIAEAIRWLTENTRPVGDIMQPKILLEVLHKLETRQDGKPAATSTARRKRMTLTNALDYAVDCEMLQANPLGTVKAARTKKSKNVRAIDTRSVVNPIQGATLLCAVEETGETGRRLKAFFGCMLYGGLRPEEATALNKTNMPGLPKSGWSELLLDEATPEISGAWSDSGLPNEARGLKHRDEDEVRAVPCPPELTELLNWHLDTFGTASDGRLFRAVRSEGRLSSSVYGRIWAKARTATFTPEVAASPLAKRPYDLRHACLSWWLAAGVDPRQVAAWAGNSLKVLLEVYAKVIDNSVRRSLALIDALFGR